MAACYIVVKASPRLEGVVGWGVVITTPKGHRWKLAGWLDDASDMRATLYAITRALETLPKRATVQVFTDIRYIGEGFTNSLDRWMRRGWRRNGRKYIAHTDLWEKIANHRDTHQLSITWADLGDDGEIARELALIGRSGEDVFLNSFHQGGK